MYSQKNHDSIDVLVNIDRAARSLLVVCPVVCPVRPLLDSQEAAAARSLPLL